MLSVHWLNSSMDDADICRRFGRNVRRIRREQEVSQERLAEMADLHRTYITSIEHGTRNPSLRPIGRIVAALKVPIDQLFE